MADKPQVRVVSAAIACDGRYLITQRKASAVLPLLWEFPGGKVEPSENDAAALVRELHYRLGIEAEVGALISCTTRDYPRYDVTLALYRCELGPLAPKPLMVRDVRWVRSDEFDLYTFTPADERAMDAMLTTARQPN